MPISISKLPEVTNVKDNSFMLITQDGTTKRTMCDQFVTEEEARLDEFSPTVITSKSMSKTGEGDNVDYSSSAYDAPMKDVVLKGKTMVNCIQEPSSQDVVLPYEFEDGQYVTINDTKESGVLGVELKGQTLVNLYELTGTPYQYNRGSNPVSVLKQQLTMGKTYMLIFNFSTVDTDGKGTINFFPVSTFTDGTAKQESNFTITESGVFKLKYTPTNTVKNYALTIGANNFDGYNPVIIVESAMIIEYQDGMENWDIPYFTGMASCKMPILKTTGKNINKYSQIDFLANSTWHDSVGTPSMFGDIGAKSKSRLLFRKGTYFISATDKINVNVFQVVDDNENILVNNVNKEFTLTEDTFLTVRFRPTDYSGIMNISAKIQIEQSSTSTTYEPYKSSILSTPSDLVLGSVGGVQDTLDVNTGKLVQRTELIDGNYQYWAKNDYVPGEKTSYFYTNNIAFKPNSTVISNKVPHERDLYAKDVFGCKIGGSAAKYLEVRIEKTKLETDDVAGFIKYLKDNDIVFRANLDKEVTKTVDLKVVDQNGNVIPTLKSWNTTTHIYSEIPENSLYPILSHSNPTYPVILKPSTKYSIVANSYSNNHTNSTINFNLGGATASTTVGNRVTTITTPSTLTSEELVMSGRGNKLNNVMVIEGDVAGDEPYFEGICDCKSPILSNVGKNLFNINGEINEKFSNMFANDAPNTVDGNTIIASSWTANYHGKGQKIKVKRGKLYTCSFTTSDNGNVVIHTPNKVNFTPVKSSTFTFTAPTDCDEIIVAFNTHGASSGGKIHNLCVVEEEVTSVEYESYKSNTTTFEQKDDKTIVLRSLPSGVCDTLNVETGEYVQRIGEVVLDGEIGMWLYPHQVRENTLENAICFQTVDISDMSSRWGSANMIYCDKLHYGNNNFGDPIESTYWGCSTNIISRMNKQLVICIDKTETNVNNQNELVNWLKSNPLTVQYKLETPIVSTIDVQGFPYAYKDGHVQLSSGSIEQSLTPKVEYNIATNRGGQITQNTKSLIRQGKLLNDIESKINQIIEATVNDSIMLMKLRNK